MNVCLICSEDFNTSNHSCISCPYCSFEACQTCCQKYILDQRSNVCMNVNKNSDDSNVCRKQWSRKFMVDNFPSSWIKGPWRKMNELVGFEREKALLPAAMPEIAKRKEKQVILTEIKDIDKQIALLNTQRREAQMKLVATNNSNNNERQSIGRPCPKENCRGFLSSQWKCSVCDMWTCPECHQLKGFTRDAHHTCNPDDVATAKLLNRDTKPCPSCRTPIHKLVGCDQMWCTQCHTGFSWRSGAIQTRIHNPHFFEWQRQNNGGVAPRRPGDFECGRDLGDSRVIMAISRKIRAISLCLPEDDLDKENLTIFQNKLETYVRGTIHLQHVQMGRFRTDQIVNNLDIRIDFLERNIDEKKFKSHILRRDKAFERKQDIFNVLQLQANTVTDIVYRLENHLQSYVAIELSDAVDYYIQQLKEHLIEIDNITNYCNNLLTEHSNTYGCKQYKLQYKTNVSGPYRHHGDVLI